jgi:outer membrane biosynthesis protein TonB
VLKLSKITLLSIIFSLIFHLILLLKGDEIVSIFNFDFISNAKSEKIELEFEQVEIDKKKDDKIKEVIDTPNRLNSESVPENAKYVSDKNYKAENESEVEKAQDLSDVSSPVSVQTLEISQEMSNKNENNSKENSEKYKSASVMLFDNETFSQNFSSKAIGKSTNNFYSDFSSRNMGGIELSTYAWDYAPYLLEFKKIIERNIFPPPAFTMMGIISGETVLSFKILPDGSITDLEVVSQQGHESLKTTSINAITNSAPFKPLPESFPEEYLGVICRFEYRVVH